MRVKYNVDTHLIFQIGDPVDHATAPFLHNAMYDLANVNAICTPVFVPRGHLPEFIQAVKTIGASGFDITMPHKSDIIPLLDECDEASRVFNCVNHVKLGSEQGCRTIDISVLVIFTYLVSGKAESQQLTDKRKTAHVIDGVHPVIVLVISHRVQYPNLLIISDRIHADIKQLRQFPNLESILFLHNIISNFQSHITIKLLAASGSV